MLRSLVTVRVSQLNWCRFCVDINAMTLIKRAGSSEKVEALANWRESPCSMSVSGPCSTTPRR